jgi:hypothetical protein
LLITETVAPANSQRLGQSKLGRFAPMDNTKCPARIPPAGMKKRATTRKQVAILCILKLDAAVHNALKCIETLPVEQSLQTSAESKELGILEQSPSCHSRKLVVASCDFK